jgi:N4-gp56 family major capsid protein
MLAIDMPGLMHGSFAMEQQMPVNVGGVAIWRRMNRLPTSKVPLKDLTPPPVALSGVDVKATVMPYGSWTVIDHGVVQLSQQDSILNDRAMLMGQQMKQTYDELIRDMLLSTSNVYNATQGGGADTPTPVSSADLNDLRTAMKRADAMKITKAISATTNISTAPIRAAFWSMCHVDLQTDLENVPGYIPAINYSNDKPQLEYEEGNFKEFRFMMTTLGAKEANASLLGNDVYTIISTGDQAYGMVNMANAMAFRAWPAGGNSDPLELQYAASWKAWWAPVLLNDQWLRLLRCTLA